MEIRIGTSGWHYHHWRGRYYPEKLPSSHMLEFYVRDFDSVEINNSFYHLPTAGTFETWGMTTPENFRFSVKGSRFITHQKKLIDPDKILERFIPLVDRLGHKLGPILFQLPPRWHCNVDRLAAFLEALPLGYRYSFEFRDASWHSSAVYQTLRHHNAAFCLYELAGFRTPLVVTADFAYVRLHGPGERYQGKYSSAALRAWARRLDRLSTQLAAAYVYFDNDEAAYAAQNASELKRLLSH
jgi:uncharacterized protein YecE (DUF72 family)